MRQLIFEFLETRINRCQLSACELPPTNAVAAVEPQYVVHQPPRLQPGNVPLAGTSQDYGLDQIELLWQTQTVGSGTSDSFQVRYRIAGRSGWIGAPPQPPIDTHEGTRLMHSVVLRTLDWDRDYEYLVDHLRQGELVAQYSGTFHTRLRSDSQRPFQFVAYGDSSAGGRFADGFRSVQQRINQIDPDFAVLLGDNIYDFGSHVDADARFTPEQSPEAVAWIASHIDWFAIGNHDAVLNLHQGQPSRDLYSVPQPKVGENAWSQPPASEFPEHNYSWDYGDVHFVTFDSNVVDLPITAATQPRLDALLDYVVADLAASRATWKIVTTHHPLLGTEKPYDSASGYYAQTVLPRLRDAGVDLLLTGDSHTYSWTYPLQGFRTTTPSVPLTEADVLYVRDDDGIYEKGSGMVQVVSGVGGRSLRSAEYADPYIARSYSTHPKSFPVEYGFTQVDVTPLELKVSYISAATGFIVGDTNRNGEADTDEPHFGQFRIRSSRADLNADGAVTVADIDRFCALLSEVPHNLDWDLNHDASLDRNDFRLFISDVVRTAPGDATLDFRVDSTDLVQVFRMGKYEQPLGDPATWSEGDWNCDGRFDSADLIAMFQSGQYDV